MFYFKNAKIYGNDKNLLSFMWCSSFFSFWSPLFCQRAKSVCVIVFILTRCGYCQGYY